MPEKIGRLYNFEDGKRAWSDEVNEELDQIVGTVNDIIDGVDGLSEGKADKEDTYTKNEVDNAVNNLQDQINTNAGNIATLDQEKEDKTAVAEAVNNLQNQIDINETNIQTLNQEKADKSNTYTKSEVDNKVWGTNNIADQAITLDKLDPAINEEVDGFLLDGRVTALEENVDQAQHSAPETTHANIIDLSNSRGGELKLDIGGQTVTNLVENGDFRDGTSGWSNDGGTISTNNNVLILTDSGTSNFSRVRQKLLVKQGKFFIRVKVRVTNDLCTRIYLGLRGANNAYGTVYGSLAIENPEKDKWYDLYLVAEGNDEEALNIILRQNYADAETAEGKEMEVLGGENGVIAIDLDQHPELQNLTAEELNEMFPHYIHETQSHTPHRVRVTGKNLFDVNSLQKTTTEGTTYQNLGDRILIDNELTGGAFSAKIKIPVKTNTKYTLTWDLLTADVGTYGGFYVYSGGEGVEGSDLRGEQLATNTYSSQLMTFETKDIDYIWIGLNLFSLHPPNTPIEIADIQLEEGDTATEYEPYEENLRYYPTDIRLREVPNGTKDTIDNEGNRVKRVSDEVIFDGTESWEIFSTGMGANADLCLGVLYNYATNNNMVNANADVLTGWANGFDGSHKYDSLRLVSSATTFSVVSTTDLIVLMPESAVSAMPSGLTLEGLKEYLSENNLTLTYQLAEPQISQIPLASLEAKKHVFYESIIGDFAFATSEGVSVSNEDYPIESLERLYKVDINTGEKTPLDISDAEIAVGGLSFTHPEIIEGDLIDFDYYFDITGTTAGEKTHSYPMNLAGELQDVGKVAFSTNQQLQKFIQEQQVIIEGQQALIDDLEARVEALEGGA